MAGIVRDGGTAPSGRHFRDLLQQVFSKVLSLVRMFVCKRDSHRARGRFGLN